MKFTYYPGCSLKGLGRSYEESFLAVFKALGVEVEELADWNCCGATAYMSVDESKAFTLASRNLALAAQAGRDMVAPCAACYLVMNKAQTYMKRYPQIAARTQGALQRVGLDLQQEVNVRHPLEILVRQVGLDVIREKVKKPLKGLKIAPYYGCQVVRPYATFDDQRNPTTMDDLFRTLGAEVVPYPLKTKCCGGSLTGTIPVVGNRLVYLLLKEAEKRGANVIATLCPLCQFNLEAYQDEVSKAHGEVTVPIVYFTQLLGLAMGLSPQELGLHRLIVPAGQELTGLMAGA